jgi:UDP-N-acetylmuramoyl-tripeptide--D-alanyl-D-alanine ligase
MIKKLTLSQLAMEFGGTLLYPDCHFSDISTDTRSIDSKQLFVALRGENFDAHNFLKSAAENACGLVVEQADTSLQIAQWVVPDTVIALGQIAFMARNQFSGVVVGVTGSAGKTTVKEMIAAIFHANADNSDAVLATRGNLNNHIGVPLTLIGLNEHHQSAVVEMGASGAGEIAYLCQISRPQISVINNILPAHVEGFGSIDAIAHAKGEIYSGLSSDGVAVLNADEEYADLWREMIDGRELITFGTRTKHVDVTASNVKADELGRCSFELITSKGSADIKLGLSGRHNISNALAAASVTLAAGVGLNAIQAGLNQLKLVAGRMDLQLLADGTRLIDDTYNANPGSVNAAIDALAAIQGKQILVLGDMAELGSDEVQLHRDVGVYAAEKNINFLMTTGLLTRTSCDGFGAGSQHFGSKSELIAELQQHMGADAVILVKGSRSSAMEDVVAALQQITEKGNR